MNIINMLFYFWTKIVERLCFVPEQVEDYSETVDQVDTYCDQASNLLPELLELIFGHLDLTSRGRVAQVSRHWRDAVYRKSLWRDDKVKLLMTQIKYDFAIFAQSLDLRGIGHVELGVVAQYNIREYSVTDITDFSLLMNKWRRDALERLYMKYDLRNLAKLSLGENIVFPTDSSIEIVCAHLKRLQSLTLISCFGLTDASLKSIACNLLQLKCLEMRDCPNITDAGIGFLTGCHPDADPAASARPMLEVLKLGDSRNLTDVCLEYLSRGQTSLKAIAISFHMTDIGMRHLSKMGQLQNVDLEFHANELSCLPETRFPQRQRKNYPTTPDPWLAIAQPRTIGFPTNNYGLQSTSVTDKGLQYLTRLSHLQSLRLPYSELITTSGLHLLIKGAPNITEINISQCRQIRRDWMSDICHLKKLRSLMVGLHQVDYHGLLHLHRTLQKLVIFLVDRNREICRTSRNLKLLVLWIEDRYT